MNEVGPLSGFTVRASHGLVSVAAEDVDYLEGARNYVRLHVGSEQYVIRATMRSLCDRLDPVRFARVHKSIIVNLERIADVQPWFGGDRIAILTTGERIRISRTYARTVRRLERGDRRRLTQVEPLHAAAASTHEHALLGQ